uniref:GDT1 family protein n=3 Tax=Odontella aurita TaxID=265563 RepID=A0A7S4MRF1_9STRA|mmetsp:Transcript_29571/g.87599  ORF Transcript_29571/g.87599 Transcript_29571/m.87599 type:complete len:350 (+) Transcript_29571:93-1142(+)|eukprot:CAMPEP_0113570318 /NCGR_PEP_ID=MMETSP0015_2-20120614/24900_1 /TAXON_ID=2838 /ORGANISM="Odontella" /LENGTH=349 /DNA_ID=CAMNT_0000473081 /DNA_START=85 /DNA_END=1134 /DNA_ORIENTATION=+ /assembly_acc=CAM_ASM_000160
MARPISLFSCVLVAATVLLHGAAAFSSHPAMLGSSRELRVNSRISTRVSVAYPKHFVSKPSLAKTTHLASKISDDEANGKVRLVSSWFTNHKLGVAAAAAVITVAALSGSASPALASASSAETVASATTMAQQFSEQLSETGFYQSFSLVFLSEIGDKTFFVAGLLAAKLSKFVSFIGSLGALAVMTILAVLIGQIFHAVPPGITQGLPIDDIAAVCAFAFFGVKILAEALDSEEGESFMDEELADAEETVEESDTINQTNLVAQIASTFALVFAAEFGDRSFLSTIALSAAQNPVAVAAGSIAAHGIATGIAVLGGAYIAKYLSEKTIGIIGGSLFIIFAITTALGIF